MNPLWYVGGGVVAFLAANKDTREAAISVAENVGTGVAEAAGTAVRAAEDVLVNLGMVPREAKPYIDIVTRVAKDRSEDPVILLAIGWRESRWGDALKPKGPGGTGDWVIRSAKWVTKYKAEQYCELLPAGRALPPGWYTGGIDVLKGAYIPADGLGWGRGLMQIDFLRAMQIDWKDPETNIDAACDVLQEKRRYLTNNYDLTPEELERATIAAYNTGEWNVAQSLESGADVDSTTAHGNYSADVLKTAQNWTVS